jgi:hypothetical protein
MYLAQPGCKPEKKTGLQIVSGAARLQTGKSLAANRT